MSDKDGVFWQGVGRVVHILKHVRARDGQNCAVVGEAQTEKRITVKEIIVWSELLAKDCKNCTDLETDVGYLWNWHNLFLFAPSQMLTSPSEPPVAKVLYSRWKDMALTG